MSTDRIDALLLLSDVLIYGGMVVGALLLSLEGAHQLDLWKARRKEQGR